MAALRRQLFQEPWEFRESVLFTAVTVLSGFLIQFAAAGKGAPQPHMPFNALFLVLLAISVTTGGLTFRNSPLVKWLGSIPLGLSLILAIALLSLIGGVVPQNTGAAASIGVRLGINTIFSGWPFALTVIFFLVNLGIGLSWKLVPFKTQNLQFILFHAGFWIALSCGVFGSTDLQRLVVPIDEGKSSTIGFTMESETPQQLPFSIFLHEFTLEEYSPNLLLFDPATEAQTNFDVHKGMTSSWKQSEVLIVDYLPSALPTEDGTLKPVSSKGLPFVNVRVSSAGRSEERWIGVTLPSQKPEPVKIGNLLVLLWPGNPKAFRSAVTVEGNNGKTIMANLEVNKPVSFMGWKLYQMGYDEKAGRFSSMSLIEVINDPWLPAVYLGFFMIMAANVLFFWNGIKRSNKA
ncbi:MAG: cytochrome c biogenesis protein ResB [Chlorobiaceae bacterium]|nr:cytochrome c biogenesis protein ResB [Chlorobiaceae bacterium]